MEKVALENAKATAESTVSKETTAEPAAMMPDESGGTQAQ